MPKLHESVSIQAYTLAGHVEFQGLHICIENKKGQTRKGVGVNGKPWSVKMPFDYGYISNTKGNDGEHVDCYIGPNKDAEYAFVVHQSKEQDKSAWDEDKVMLGFNTADAAIKAYKSAYVGVDLFQSMTVLPMAAFKAALKSKKIKLTASYGMAVGEDYHQFREGVAMQPQTRNHPPSLKNPMKVPVDNPDAPEDKYGDRKKRRSKNTKKIIREMARRQSGKPEIVNTTMFVPFNMG